jgi:hypothetical protein
LLPAPRSLAALLAVAARLEASAVPFLVVGGCGRALLGSPRRPSDVDLEVDGPDALRAADALGLGLAIEGGGGVSGLRARGRLAGMEVDLSADLSVEGPGGSLGPDWDLQRAWATPVRVGGRTLWVAPPEEMLLRARVRGDHGRAARLAAQGPPVRQAYIDSRLRAARAKASS